MAQAITLGRSVRKTNPQVRFVIGLVDEWRPDISVQDMELLLVTDAMDPQVFRHMCRIYNITELCTAVKPHYIEYFLKNQHAETVVYLDPDIIVYGTLDQLFDYSKNHSVVVTPHFCTPPGDSRFSSDIRVLSGGVYNLGFICMSNSPKGAVFLDWWKEKSLRQFFINLDFFTDQLWVNCVTCFVEDAFVLRNPGYNVANWNLHERQISQRNGTFFVNEAFPLIFFHYSHYSPMRPGQMTSLNPDIRLSERPDVEPVFRYYCEQLQANGFEAYRKIQPAYIRRERKWLPGFIRRLVVRVCVKILLLLKHG